MTLCRFLQWLVYVLAMSRLECNLRVKSDGWPPLTQVLFYQRLASRTVLLDILCSAVVAAHGNVDGCRRSRCSLARQRPSLQRKRQSCPTCFDAIMQNTGCIILSPSIQP